ncbi:non-specific lipid transfer protein GPI-anchored 9-like [Aristolochia californica]|uniref:non-specific lipid transfer protein GPI-anchored 9-like n=1 Tax=Aristolochia californica TaxID=171875 RepID=UPI0035D5E882
MKSFLKNLIVVALMAALATGAWGQQMPECASKLIPCQDFLNSTSPPSSCCGPMRDAVKNDLACLCNLFRQSELFKAFNINITQALELPKHCGITDGIGACKTASAPAPTGGVHPPSTPGGENKAGRVGVAGASTLTGVVLLWASTVIRA